MENKNLERLAYAGAEMPDNLSYADALYFMLLRPLYAATKEGKIEAEQGKREKARIVDIVRHYRSDMDLVISAAGMRNTVSAALSDYRKAKSKDETIAAADRIVEALDKIKVERKF